MAEHKKKGGVCFVLLLTLANCTTTPDPVATGTSKEVYYAHNEKIVSYTHTSKTPFINQVEVPQDAALAGALSLINAKRTAAGLAALSPHPMLNQLAQSHAEGMSGAQMLSHDVGGGDLRKRTRKAGASFRKITENLARGQRTPARLIEAWGSSSSHKKNMMDPKVAYIGVGRGPGDYWVTLFASR